MFDLRRRGHRGHRIELRLALLGGSFGGNLLLPSTNIGRANNHMAEEGLATKKHLMVISAVIGTFLRETSEAPEIELTTEGSIVGVLKELTKNVLSEHSNIMHTEAPAVRLP